MCRPEAQWSTVDHAETTPSHPATLSLTKGQKPSPEERLFNKLWWLKWIFTCQTLNLDTYPPKCTKVKSKYKTKTLTLLEVARGQTSRQQWTNSSPQLYSICWLFKKNLFVTSSVLFFSSLFYLLLLSLEFCLNLKCIPIRWHIIHVSFLKIQFLNSLIERLHQFTLNTITNIELMFTFLFLYNVLHFCSISHLYLLLW